MLELRSLWAFILGINLCLVIWRISVQEPIMLHVEVPASGTNIKFKVQQPASYGGKHLLADYQAHLQPQNESSIAIISNDSNGEADFGIPNSGANSKLLNPLLITREFANYKKLPQSRYKKEHSSHNQNIKKKLQNRIVAQNVYNHSGFLTTNNAKIRQNDSPRVISKAHVKQLHATPSTTRKSPLIQSTWLPPYLNSEDRHRLIDLYNFSYVLLHPQCSPETNTLILIHSAPQNIAKRMLIRETWADSSLFASTPIQHIFLLGTVDREELQVNLTIEHAEYNDIVQGNFIDDYRNMTYKHVMALKWFLYNCAHAKLLIKVDDDVFVNTPQLLKYMREQTHLKQPTPKFSYTQSFNPAHSLYNPDTKGLLFCEPSIGSKVKRSYRSKWRVSFKEYKGRYYPPYCPGYVVIYTGDVVQRLYLAAQNHSYFWIDDVHITGVLAQVTNTTITPSHNYVLFSADCDELQNALTVNDRSATNSYETDLTSKIKEFLYASHSITPEQMRTLWVLYKAHVTKYSSIKNKSYVLTNPSSNNLSSTIPYLYTVDDLAVTALAGVS